jgi:hypothetical protein
MNKRPFNIHMIQTSILHDGLTHSMRKKWTMAVSVAVAQQALCPLSG